MARHSIPDIIERAEPREARGSAPARPLGMSLVRSLRPAQWTKNLIIFGPLLLGQRLRDGVYVGTLLDGQAVLYSIAAFAIFCALSGVVYLLNDVADREADARHPIKRFRPIASGAVPVSTALGTAIVLGTVALGAAFWLRPAFGLLGAGYLGLLAVYSGPLKHVVIIDVLTIAVGFVLRAAAGAVVINVAISHWLLILTILLALFLALSKRRHELVLLADDATSHRRILQEYSPYLLDQMISVVTASTLLAYAFYTVSPETIQKFGSDRLVWTLPFPLYGIFRYLYLVHQKEGGGSPAEMLVTDRPLLVCVAVWVIVLALIIYWSQIPILKGLSG
jgi:4-hydroxybenzoate polyprenyltransferase